MVTKIRRGSILIYTILLLPVFAGICLLAVDWARVQLTKSQLMRTADAAARYAVTGASDGTALTKANVVGSKNLAAGSTVVFQAADVETGRWQSNTFTAGSTPSNAVRVTARRTSATGNPVSLAFGFLIGASSKDTTAKAIALIKPYGYGVIGLNSIKMGGNSSISYKATSGATSGHGDIASNGDITLSGSTNIQGDARPGIGKSVIGGSGRVSGSTTPLTTALSYPSESASTYSTSNNNNQIPAGTLSGKGDINLGSGASLTLPGGVYYIHHLNIGAGGELTFSGPATVCVWGDLTYNGHATTNANMPKNLRIVQVKDPSTNTIGKFNFGSASALYASIYAPDSAITLSGNGDIYGSIVGQSIDMSGTSGIHYDLSLSGGGDISLVQ